MEKVKYNRFEYRNEYLKSDEWKTLRSTILGSGCDCQCCKNVKAMDVHHMVYRNIVDIKISDLIPVCRNCHDFIHQAISDGYISQDVRDLELIKIKTFGILTDENYKIFRQWLDDKHLLEEREIEEITNAQSFVIKKISSLIRKNIWYTDLPNKKFTGRQILKIRKLIEVSKFRRSERIDTPVKRGIVLANSKYEKTKSLKGLPGFKTRKGIDIN